MSFINNNQEIYNEMERGSYRKSNGIASRLVASVLFLSIGFASGNIYSIYKQNESKNTVLSTNNSSVLATISQNNSSTTSNTANSSSVFTLPGSISEIASKNCDSVVEITTATNQNTYFGNYTATGSGSGVIISSDGYILTNNHVIDSAKEISIRLHDGTEHKATVVGSDARTDIGILKVEATNLKPVTIGNSDELIVGDLAVVIGNPLGELGGTVTDGIISALEREIVLDGSKMNLIQTNAAINPGNSGGGLFNSKGELVGIVVAKSSGLDIEGLGFAIPINDVKNVITDILDLGYVSGRPFLGVELTDSKQTQLPSNSIWGLLYGQTMTTTSYGAYVAGIIEGSAAEKAGIKVDDQIISINDEMISTADEVTATIAEYAIGDTVKIGLVRDNKMLSVEATLQEYKGE